MEVSCKSSKILVDNTPCNLEHRDSAMILLVEEILHHLGCIKPCRRRYIYYINWLDGFLPSTVVLVEVDFYTVSELDHGSNLGFFRAF